MRLLRPGLMAFRPEEGRPWDFPEGVVHGCSVRWRNAKPAARLRQHPRYLIRKVKRTRTTLRDIAVRCGVSATAVSLALRNHRSISEATRERIRAAAAALDYRPDPALAAPNQYRHRRASTARGYVLAYVTCFERRHGWQASPFFRRAFQGGRECAETLGDEIEHAWLTGPGVSSERFAQVLESRGMRGLIVAPLPQPGSRLELPWERFSCVAIGPSLVSPALHGACGDQYQAAMLALQRLTQFGYRRVGLPIDPDADRRHQGKYQAALP